MTGSLNNEDRSMTCGDCGPLLQDYLDGTLAKTRSLEVFLHVRDCRPCHMALEEMKQVYAMLDSLPEVEVPEDFDARILSSIPYQAYRDMEPLRRDRVPVFLEEDFLPTPLRDLRTRVAGGVLAAGAAVGLAAGWLPDASVIAVAVGAIPEAIVRFQALARRVTLAGHSTESG